MIPELPANEVERVRALRDYEILDSAPEKAFDDLTVLTSTICGTPTALISLIDECRQWIKARVGIDAEETTRDVAFCAHTILHPEDVLIVEDTEKDERFAQNPFVTGEPFIRFYAGAPLVTKDGFALGSLCVVDYKPRILSPEQISSLKLLANQVVSQLELRRSLNSNIKLQERNQQLFEYAADGIHLYDFAGNILSVNQRFCEITGRNEDELLQMKVQNLISANELAKKPIRFKDLRKGKLLISERIIIRPDNSKVTVEVSGRMLDENTIQGIMRDITERKQTENTLLETERRFRDFLNSSLAYFCTHEIDGTVLSVSPAAVESLGYSEAELVGENLSKILLPDAIEILPFYLQQLVAEGTSRGFMNIRTKSGEKRVWSYSNIVRTDSNGKKYVLGSAQDLTELFKKEEELKRSENLFRSYINNSPAVIYMKDEDGRIELMNRSFEELFKVNFADLQGKKDSDYLPSEIAEAVQVNDKFVLENNKSIKVEEFVPTPDGASHYWLSHKFPITDSTGKKHLGGISINITERKLAEDELKAARDAALESSRLKTAFLTNVSHEIRTPMNGIIGMTELLLDTPLNSAQLNYAETIRRSGDTLLAVINDILDLAKIEAGKMRFENVDFDLHQTIASTVEMLAERAFQKNLEISTQIETDVPQFLSGDAERVRQVLTNLIGNAIKYTETGEIGIRVKVDKSNENNIILRFNVTDTGIGIAPQNLKYLFQPFVQIDDSTTRRFGGTGLGLVISKQIVEMMNGEISVVSNLGEGSDFSFTICFDNAQNDYQNIKNQDLLPALKGKKVLLANAKKIAGQTLQNYLSDWGIESRIADNGAETIKFLADAAKNGEPFEMVIIDTNLTDGAAFTLVQQIKNDDLIGCTKTILAASLRDLAGLNEQESKFVSKVLKKPFQRQQIFDCLVSIINVNEEILTDNFTESETVNVTRTSRNFYAQNETELNLNSRGIGELLLVEDNEVNQILILRQLEKLGLTADVAFDGLEALEKYRQKPYQIILMDCQMPRFDGYQTTAEIRRLEREKYDVGESFSHTIIIAVTAHSLEGEREKCISAGMDDYLSKPVKMQELSTMLDFWSQPKEVIHHHHPEFSEKVEETDEVSDEIKELFITETQKHISEIKKSLENANFAQIAGLAHSVRGNALAVGRFSMAETLKSLEKSAKLNNYDDVLRHFDSFMREFSL